MKRLFLTLGLVIAFLISTLPVRASIFDGASSLPPKPTSNQYGTCLSNNYKVTTDNVSREACTAIGQQLYDTMPTGDYFRDKCHAIASYYAPYKYEFKKINENETQRWFINCNSGTANNNTESRYPLSDFRPYAVTETSYSCPPDDSANYTFGMDSNQDSKVDKCFNPDELDNLSKCVDQVGSMLPAITNLSTKVCKTDPTTGASCGYSKKDTDVVYKLDLEVSCFGDGEKVPEYDPEPMPKPDTCAKVNDQLMVCKEDPKKKCDAIGRCADQCGFVNKEFYCFQQCTGEECDKPTPPPVNCETNPTAPVCVEEPEPDPEFCKANPTDPKCTTKPPEPCTGDDCGSTGGGGTGQKIDLTPVVDQLKDLNKKLDFSTNDKTARSDFGAFSDLFSSSDIQAIKNMTDEKKQEITEQITTIKAEFKDMFEVTANGGAYTDITLNLSMGDFHPQFWSFIQANIGIIGAIVMALAYLMAIRIISE